MVSRKVVSGRSQEPFSVEGFNKEIAELILSGDDMVDVGIEVYDRIRRLDNFSQNFSNYISDQNLILLDHAINPNSAILRQLMNAAFELRGLDTAFSDVKRLTADFARRLGGNSYQQKNHEISDYINEVYPEREGLSNTRNIQTFNAEQLSRNRSRTI